MVTIILGLFFYRTFKSCHQLKYQILAIEENILCFVVALPLVTKQNLEHFLSHYCLSKKSYLNGELILTIWLLNKVTVHTNVFESNPTKTTTLLRKFKPTFTQKILHITSIKKISINFLIFLVFSIFLLFLPRFFHPWNKEKMAYQIFKKILYHFPKI